ncbi:MAG: cell envelope integrity protein CreD [Bacteroidales bacterium]|jgi:inner membrane protein|nr:cell envelope integrity protein CreD [Bacteroidales bacterium]
MTAKNEAKFWIKNSITIKFIVIGIIILALLIPAEMIKNLIHERNGLRNNVVSEVSYKWGNPQTIAGPIITIPYKQYFKKDKEIIEKINYAQFLPEELNVKGTINPEIRYRSIYKVVVYNANLNFSGSFNKPDFSLWNIPESDILWNEATLSIRIPDMRGIKDVITVKWDKHKYDVNPGINTPNTNYTGVSTLIDINKSDNFNFQFDLNINGSESLNFIPVGKQTNVDLNSEWTDPSFEGSFLPNNRDISEAGFSAGWKVLHLNRSYPQQWIGDKYTIDESSFGVKLLLPVDHYQKSLRSVKYAIMFIALTFLIFFFTEILNKKRIHPIQYLLVGLGLSVFYTLLVSLSEQISFNLAYLIASFSIISLITAYSYSLLKSKKLTAIVALVLIILYVFLFTVIQLQDYSLLLGSIGLFIALAIVMYLSRKVDWYSNLTSSNSSDV